MCLRVDYRPKNLGLHRHTIHVITVTFFYVFLKIQKSVTFYVFFALLHTFSRTIWNER